MKKSLLFSLMVSAALLTGCLFELDAQFNTYIPMEVPFLDIPLLPGISTNLVAETGISNMLQGITGQYAEINELSMDWILTNNSSNDVTIAIGLTGMSIVSNYQVQYTNYTSYHVPSSNQTAWIVPLVTLTQGQITNGLYISGSVNPLLRNLLIASNNYQLVIQTYVENPGAIVSNKNISLSFAVKQGMVIQRAFSDMPGMISLFQ